MGRLICGEIKEISISKAPFIALSVDTPPVSFMRHGTGVSINGAIDGVDPARSSEEHLTYGIREIDSWWVTS